MLSDMLWLTCISNQTIYQEGQTPSSFTSGEVSVALCCFGAPAKVSAAQHQCLQLCYRAGAEMLISRVPVCVMRFMASGVSVPTSLKQLNLVDLLWTHPAGRKATEPSANHRSDKHFPLRMMVVVQCWPATNGLLVRKSASRERPRVMRPLSLQTHTSHFKGKCSETQIITKAGVRLLSLLSAEATLLWDPHGTREEKAWPGRNLTLQPGDGGRRDGESWTLVPVAGVTYQSSPESLHRKMCTQVIFTTGIRPLSFLFHAKTFTSPLAILKATFPHGNIWSKHLLLLWWYLLPPSYHQIITSLVNKAVSNNLHNSF